MDKRKSIDNQRGHLSPLQDTTMSDAIIECTECRRILPSNDINQVLLICWECLDAPDTEEIDLEDFDL